MADNPSYQSTELSEGHDPNQEDVTGTNLDPGKEEFDGHPSADAYNVSTVEATSEVISMRSRRQHVENGTEAEFSETTGDNKKSSSGLLYTVDEVPVWYMTILFGFQQYLVMVVATVSVPFILTPLLCIDDDDPVRGRLVCTIIFVSGLITLLQTTFGVRLPIVQGGTFSFLVPTIAFINTAFPKCEDLPLANVTFTQQEEEWKVRMRAVQGAIVITGVFQVVIGFTGLMGLLLTWITPLTIVPTIVLIGLALFEVAMRMASLHWGISSFTIVLMLLFSQFLKDIPLPCPAYTRSSGFHIIWVHVFKLFSLLLAILVSWCLCWLLTVTDSLPHDNRARTDSSNDLIRLSPWISVPYPGQWGLPTVSLAAVLGMLAGMTASMVESIGDYYACARISGAPSPPTHAMNRGIGVEGLGGVLAGLWGTGNGTTSISINIGAIGITKVGSRRVMQAAAVFMMLFGMLGKFGAVFACIPSPVIGGMFCILFGMIVAVGFSPLQFVDLNSSRNLFILGFSIFIGLALPKWMEKHPGVVDTGVILLDQLLTVLLQTSMLIGGFLGCFLDNLVPGTLDERGLTKWRAQYSSTEKSDEGKADCYDLPFGMHAIKRATWLRYIPFSPTFRGFTKK